MDRNRSRFGWCVGPALLLAALHLTSCASLPDKEIDPLPPSDSLASTLTYVEAFQGGGAWKVPTTRHLAEIDYKSRLQIVPDKEVLKTIG